MANIPTHFDDIIDLKHHYNEVMELKVQVNNCLLIGQSVAGNAPATNYYMYIWYHGLIDTYQNSVFNSGGRAASAYHSIAEDLTSFSGVYEDIKFKTFFSDALSAFTGLQGERFTPVPDGDNPFCLPAVLQDLVNVHANMGVYAGKLNQAILTYEYGVQYNLFEEQTSTFKGIKSPGVIGFLKNIFK